MDRKQEFAIIGKICERAEALGLSDPEKRFNLFMDLDKTNESIGLNLDGLLAADDMNFSHDIVGIQTHMNRSTGELEDFFLPRYAKQDVASLVEDAVTRSQEHGKADVGKSEKEQDISLN